MYRVIKYMCITHSIFSWLLVLLCHSTSYWRSDLLMHAVLTSGSFSELSKKKGPPDQKQQAISATPLRTLPHKMKPNEGKLQKAVGFVVKNKLNRSLLV